MKKLTRKQVIKKLKKGDKNFRGLDLRMLDLSNLDLSYCDLSNTNLFHADLFNTNLSYSNLSIANLNYANLSYCDLSNANLIYANLYNTNLFNSNLINANLDYANLYGSNLDSAKLDEKEQIRKGIILEEPMIGYKKCINDIIVTLEIPTNAIVFSINNKQCRTNKAKVVDISDDKKIAYSNFNDSFAYKLGQEIEIKDFDLMYNVECASGIHFFKTKEEAENY